MLIVPESWPRFDRWSSSSGLSDRRPAYTVPWGCRSGCLADRTWCTACAGICRHNNNVITNSRDTGPRACQAYYFTSPDETRDLAIEIDTMWMNVFLPKRSNKINVRIFGRAHQGTLGILGGFSFRQYVRRVSLGTTLGNMRRWRNQLWRNCQISEISDDEGKKRESTNCLRVPFSPLTAEWSCACPGNIWPRRSASWWYRPRWIWWVRECAVLSSISNYNQNTAAEPARLGLVRYKFGHAGGMTPISNRNLKTSFLRPR